VNIHASVAAIVAAAVAVSGCDRIAESQARGAGGAGRYQVVALTNGSRNENTVFLLDTRDGDMWEWDEYAVADIGYASTGMSLQYIGRLTPGKEMGQVIHSIKRESPSRTGQ